MAQQFNKNFYTLANELVKAATGGQLSGIVDYNSFVDIGTKFKDANKETWYNDYFSQFANKVQLVLDYVRAYTGSYSWMRRGTVNGGIIELITHVFYESEKAEFIGVPDGASIDPFVVKKAELNVDYFTKEVAWTFHITKQSTDLKGAVTDPSKLEGLWTSIFTDLSNSRELVLENNRINMLNKLIVDAIDNGAESTSYTAGATAYNLLTIYNTMYGTSLDADEALSVPSFTSFIVMAIKHVQAKMARVSNKFNIKGIKGFTPESAQKLLIPSVVKENIERNTINAFNTQPAILTNYEEVPFWQTNEDELVIATEKDGEEGKELDYTAPVIGVIIDSTWSIGEYIDIQDASAIYNPRGMYSNFFWNQLHRYVVNEYASSVVFLLA